MNVSMAGPTDRNGFHHLSSRKVLLEPLILMTSSWNQMMFRGAGFCDTLAQRAGIWVSQFSHRQ